MVEQIDKLNNLESRKKGLLDTIYRYSLNELDAQRERAIMRISLIDWNLDPEEWELYESMLEIIEKDLTDVKVELEKLRIELELVDFELDKL
ncbi:MAG: hypothetical protein NW226_12690 [Microscillaceae bacterium]|nr:hypothetical protein [Microscillaceae bacterium]